MLNYFYIFTSKKRIRCFALLGIIFSLSMPVIEAQTSYPVPPKNTKMLFYLQRSFNKNTIVYETNTLADGKLNIENPIKIHWIRYEDDGRIADLSYIQRKAYGMKSISNDKANSSFTLSFNNFNRRKLIMRKSSAGVYKAFMKINNQDTELESVFIKSEKNVLGMQMIFKYIEVSGTSTVNGTKNTERIML